MRLTFVGNHSVSFSTESHLAWTFEYLGWEVIRLQENKTTVEDVVSAANSSDLFLWVRTHGWEVQGDVHSMLDRINVPTVGFHLDRYWGLDILDRRESMIGVHPWWHVDYLFTADGGNQENFKAKGVNHYWLPPAVVEKECYPGTQKDEYKVDVAFVGSKGYHPEYKERGQLIDWLEETYGSRFRRFAGDSGGTVREQALNDLYASVKVVVGDSCFAGSPYYYSDRVPETIGRHGFLIHPETKGLFIEGLVTYRPNDFADLKEKIDYYLEHDDERRNCIEKGSIDVKKNHTYTNRVKQMLKVVND